MMLGAAPRALMVAEAGRREQAAEGEASEGEVIRGGGGEVELLTVVAAAKSLAMEPETGWEPADAVPVKAAPVPETVKVSAFEMPPPEGLVTVIGAVPTLATSVAGMAAVTCVAVTK